MRTETRWTRFALATWLCCIFTMQANAERPNGNSIEFQGQSWKGSPPVQLDAIYHQGQNSLRVRTNGADSIATVEGVQFQTGTIEMDVSAPQRSHPTLALFVDESGMNYDRITLNPWPQFNDQLPRRLRQGVVTTGVHQSVVVNFNHGNSVDWARERWFHVRLEVDEGICRIYIDDDARPAFLFATSDQAKSGGGVGIVSSSAFIRNLKICPLKQQAAKTPFGNSVSTRSIAGQIQ
ncbi:hypothetical protein [Rhodopirellula europaea]|uniref:hypothetical protein n=1 Tax=Rhodopirellula europaea TaxID=1263866 RepID=UPI003D2E809F